MPYCQAPECRITPSYGLPGKKPIFCVRHAKFPEMVMFNRRKCQIAECKVTPSYGYYGRRPVRCSRHVEPDMIRLGYYCRESGCELTPSFRPPDGKSPKACKAHAEPGWISVNLRRKCYRENCSTTPSFGPIEGDRIRAISCLRHAAPGWTSVRRLQKRLQAASS